MIKKIIPAIIAKDQEELSKRIERLKGLFDTLQLDVMDGKFVPNHSLDFKFHVPKTYKYEAHLMVSDPKRWINENWKIADIVLVHMESLKDPEHIIKLVKSKGIKIGIVLNPETPAEKIKPYLNELNQVLIMTVDPGFYGSEFLPETLEKVKELRKLKPNLDIEVDGSITADTIKSANDAGANLFVSGSYLQKSRNIKETVLELKKEIA